MVDIANMFDISLAALTIWAVVAVVLKGFGLWYAARGKQLGWFIAILIVSLGGIIPGIYLLFFRKDKR